jgi:ABC-type nitrate/sulfonate/bicarbonate transport system substrate-binding protein
MAKLWIFLCTLVMFVFIISTSCTKKSEQAMSEKPEARLAAFQLYVSGLVVAADESKKIIQEVDCFAEANLGCTIIKRSKGPEIVDALVGGSADFGTLANTPVVLQALQGSDLVIFATIQTTDHDIKVVGHETLGVIEGSSLKGKRIGFVGGTIGEIFLNRYLTKHGIDKSEVTLTSAGPAQLRDLFLSKSVDAIIIWEPIIQDILKDKSVDRNEIFLDVDRSLYVLRMHLVARPQVLKEKREAAQNLVKALICGENLVKKYPDKVRELLELWLDRQPGTLINIFEEETFRIGLDVPKLLVELKQEAEWAQEAVFSGKANIPDDFSRFVDPSILNSIDPDRVKK